MIIPLIVLALVFILIAVRQIGNIRLQIWHIMLGGALIVLLTRQISITDAYQAINFDVLIFLLCMFIIGVALEESGYLSHLSYKIFRRARTLGQLLFMILLIMGIGSAFLMNDTLAIIGTPVMLLLAKKHGMHARILLLALAFAVTIGSVMSPIGNPQNLLIALEGGIRQPFLAFFYYLALPTCINLLAAYAILRLFYREHFHTRELYHAQEPIKDHQLAFHSKLSLLILIIMIVVKITLAALEIELPLTAIAIAGALPLIILSARRIEIVRKADWHTIIFFAAMFVLMQSVWNTGFFQGIINGSHIPLESTTSILSISVLLSQLISNVPLVALYLPMLMHLGVTTDALMALAAGSTIAGNLLILGAASNVIIIQNAEKKGETITFLEFAKVGIPLTIINVLIYYFFFLL